MATRRRVTTGYGRPHRDGRREPRRDVHPTGRPVPTPTGVRAVTDRDRRGLIVGGPVAWDAPTRVPVATVLIDPAGIDEPVTRVRWMPLADTLDGAVAFREDDHRPDANVYGTRRTPRVGATPRAAAERERQSAVAASRREALRIRERIRARAGCKPGRRRVG